jgi:hypothetical protein
MFGLLMSMLSPTDLKYPAKLLLAAHERARRRRSILSLLVSSNVVTPPPVRGIYGWSPQQRSQNSAEETLRLARSEVGETVL